jgi:hypothetical protein
VVRAHRGIAVRARRPAEPAAHRRLMQAFLAAARAGRLAELEQLPAADAALAGPGAR